MAIVGQKSAKARGCSDIYQLFGLILPNHYQYELSFLINVQAQHDTHIFKFTLGDDNVSFDKFISLNLNLRVSRLTFKVSHDPI